MLPVAFTKACVSEQMNIKTSNLQRIVSLKPKWLTKKDTFIHFQFRLIIGRYSVENKNRASDQCDQKKVAKCL